MKVFIKISVPALVVFSIAITGCKDKKTAQCEKAYNRISKCLPGFAVQKDTQINLCVQTFEKSSTRGAIQCTKMFDNCEQFKSCLNFGAMCRDFEGKLFDKCLKESEKCTAWKGSEFKSCIKCINDKGLAGEELKTCVREASGESIPINATKKEEVKSPAGDTMKPEEKKTVPVAPEMKPSTPLPPSMK